MQFRDLPPLHFLPAFEAAGRLGSFKAAAAELRLTPPAISQQLKAIEDALGVALFERRGRTVRLTAAGETYLRDVQQLLSEAATATRRVRERSTQRVLRVSMPDFVAYDFMLARLSQFRTAFPGVELNVEASPRVVDFATCDIDAAFRVAEGSWPNLVGHVVGDAHIALVCAPELARQLRTVSQLRHHGLIELRGQERRGWRAFMKRHGLPEPQQLLCFDGYLEVLRAAEQGLGVAFGIFPMATERVTSGRLAVPLPFRVPFAGKVSFVYRKAEARDPLFSELAAWLRQQYAELPALPEGRVLRRSRLRSDKLSSRSTPR